MTKKYLLLLILLFSSIASFSQSITVGGDFDKFYPVTWTDPAWGNNEATVLQLGRSSVYENGVWRGALISRFNYHISGWGHGASFIDASIKSSVTSFIAGWHDASAAGASGFIIIWLRGGNTTYYYHGNYPVTPVVYDGVQNPLPLQENNGPAHTYKTSIDTYVNSNGVSNSGLANFSGIGNNYFAGNVGIGTTSPVQKLVIQGTGQTISEINSIDDNAALYVRAGSTLHYPHIRFDQVGSGKMEMGVDPSQGFYFNHSTSTGSVDADLYLAPNKNVGIGTITPSDKLSVNGKIRAREVKVETINWPDYVFKPGHKLPSLIDVENFIQKNKHLPEIPSAAEVESNGVNLGEMNAKLLKKIEELTLYVIELTKENIDIKQSLKELKK